MALKLTACGGFFFAAKWKTRLNMIWLLFAMALALAIIYYLCHGFALLGVFIEIEKWICLFIDFKVLHCNETAVAESVMGLLTRGAFLKLHVSLMGKVLKKYFRILVFQKNCSTLNLVLLLNAFKRNSYRNTHTILPLTGLPDPSIQILCTAEIYK